MITLHDIWNIRKGRDYDKTEFITSQSFADASSDVCGYLLQIDSE